MAQIGRRDAIFSVLSILTVTAMKSQLNSHVVRKTYDNMVLYFSKKGKHSNFE